MPAPRASRIVSSATRTPKPHPVRSPLRPASSLPIAAVCPPPPTPPVALPSAPSSSKSPYLPGDFFTSTSLLPTASSSGWLDSIWPRAEGGVGKGNGKGKAREDELHQGTFFKPTLSFSDDAWRSSTVGKKTSSSATSSQAEISTKTRLATRDGPSLRRPPTATPVSTSSPPTLPITRPPASPTPLSFRYSPSSPSRSPPDDPSPPDSPASLSDSAWLGALSQTLDHLHSTLPNFFPTPPSFPPNIFSPEITLTLPGAGPVETLQLSGLRTYSLFFSASRASLAIALRDPWVRVESVKVTPPSSKEGTIQVSSDEWMDAPPRPPTPSSDEGVPPRAHAGKDWMRNATVISKARLGRQVRVRVKVGGKLRLPLPGAVLGGVTELGDQGEREWTISKSFLTHSFSNQPFLPAK